MKLSKLVVTAAFVASAMGLASGTAYADPAADAPAQSGDVNYESHLEDRTIVTTIDAGVFKVADDGKTVDVLDQADKVLVTLPLSFNLGGLNFPYEQNVDNDGKTLRLVPQLDFNKASLRSSDLPAVNTVASPDENLKAQQTFSSQLALATAIGSLSGSIVGAGVGCLIGGTPPALTVVGIPAAVLTCIGGALIGAPIGALAGTITAGGPTLVIAGVDLVNTLIAPPGTTKFAN
ncbi:hypothetical protein [Rhodococcoides kyotonense]|uniref:DUF8020 domain-containing protein n=1 Tax=Rhodococcoides kyotonense TaxID=398843 RepID=A0A177YGW9_9NOCA|nr:hypothetical protein [Rhodococcus kyotonensis]OAK54725.1 hypothetical protein A3K89_05160 [Rhodococcus kyotonensis]